MMICADVGRTNRQDVAKTVSSDVYVLGDPTPSHHQPLATLGTQLRASAGTLASRAIVLASFAQDQPHAYAANVFETQFGGVTCSSQCVCPRLACLCVA